jgi:hypothetical protein
MSAFCNSLEANLHIVGGFQILSLFLRTLSVYKKGGRMGLVNAAISTILNWKIRNDGRCVEGGRKNG